MPQLLALLRLMRAHHWVKNVLVLVPLVTSFSLADATRLRAGLVAFIALSLIASATYIVNDLMDLPHDRQHPHKRLRPLAAGQIAAWLALLVALMLLGLGSVLAWCVNADFFRMMVMYVVLTLSYSRWLKACALIDVLALVALWNIRLWGGALAIGVSLSVWLLSFGAFVFLSLSLLKRAIELHAGKHAPLEYLPGRGYRPADLPWVQSLGLAAVVAATVVLALFVDSSSAQGHYAEPARLWLLCPAIFYWLSRLWLKMQRGEMQHDPVAYSLTDGVSWWVGAVVVASVVWAHGVWSW